jgi:flagellar biosynthetic protein FliQ
VTPAEIVMDIGRQAVEMTLLMSAPLLLARTGHRPDRERLSGRDADQRADARVHSQAGGHVPAVLLLAGPWMLQLMVEYVRRLFESIPLLVG